MLLWFGALRNNGCLICSVDAAFPTGRHHRKILVAINDIMVFSVGFCKIMHLSVGFWKLQIMRQKFWCNTRGLWGSLRT